MALLLTLKGLTPNRFSSLRDRTRLGALRSVCAAFSLTCFLWMMFPAEKSAADELKRPQTRVITEAAIGMVAPASIQPPAPQPALVELRGWDHLYLKMVRQGADPELLKQVFLDQRMPERSPLLFSLNPKEPPALYRKHNTKANRKNAIRFYREHDETFKLAEQRYQVPASVILSILQVETHCGRVTGRSPIFPALARLAAAATPQNIETNIEERNAHTDPELAQKIEARANWLESTFLPHAVAALTLARTRGLHPLSVQGSGAGAIGMPQFLPGHVTAFGADGNGDGTINLFTPEDAIHSVARFLHNHGWKQLNLTHQTQADVIWHYNHSSSYVSTVLNMARDLRLQMKAARPVVKVAAK